MTNIIMPRRSFITGLVGLVAAPAVVKASSLMQVRTIAQTDYLLEHATERYIGYTQATTGYFITRERTNITQSTAVALIEHMKRVKAKMANYA